ncbi:hypothetical protein O6H91_20G045500 [Diphasiastrum complanatum]|uniref:Uncharacterized protein n=1 Tax=Diphasiastrum complanatum TaxID=34168 RepID=A0ACC2APT2_DIPCM|nr:hypothetical protein O6H91_20G045500 [Diphasiastrum complanatum]
MAQEGSARRDEDGDNESILTRFRDTCIVARELRDLYAHASDANKISDLLLQLQHNMDSLLQDRARVQALILELREEVHLAEQRLEKEEAGATLNEEISMLKTNLTKLRDQSEELEEVARDIEEQLNARKEQQVQYHTQMETLKKSQALLQRAHNELALYAQVTKVIPDLDEPHSISGSIVDQKGRSITSFELDPKRMSAYEVCQTLWDMSS